MWDESSGKSKAQWIKISGSPALVNRLIKATRGVERQKQKVERLPTSNKARASAGVGRSTAGRPVLPVVWTFPVVSFPVIKAYQSLRVRLDLMMDFPSVFVLITVPPLPFNLYYTHFQHFISISILSFSCNY